MRESYSVRVLGVNSAFFEAGLKRLLAHLLISFLSTIICAFPALCQIDDAADLRTQQEQERNELGDMKRQMEDIKSNMQNALQDMSKVQSMMKGDQVKEFHLQVKESVWEIFPGAFMNAFTYNNQTPGPVLRVSEGDQVRIVLHNGLKTATSLYIQGMQLPHKVDGLPRKGGGLVNPGETFVYQFIASQPGTFYYRPQVPHLDQMHKGLAGVIVVEPRSIPKTYERDQVIVLSQAASGDIVRKSAGAPSGSAPPRTQSVFLANGKSAQSVTPLDLKNGERMRLRIINVSPESCTFTLTGHRFEVVSQNGSDGIEPHVMRDTVSLDTGERVDLEFSADNPGVWSLSSLKASQASFNGQFPGGFAMVVRYPDALK